MLLRRRISGVVAVGALYLTRAQTRRQARREGEGEGVVWKQLTPDLIRGRQASTFRVAPLRLFVCPVSSAGFVVGPGTAVCRLSAGMILNACFDAISGHGSWTTWPIVPWPACENRFVSTFRFCFPPRRPHVTRQFLFRRELRLVFG